MVSFLFCNHQQPIYALLEVFEPLRHSVAAFSALVYSMKFDIKVRERAFLYYALALQELRWLSERVPAYLEEYLGLVATVLQLSAFDVFLRIPSCKFVDFKRLLSTFTRYSTHYAAIFEPSTSLFNRCWKIITRVVWQRTRLLLFQCSL